MKKLLPLVRKIIRRAEPALPKQGQVCLFTELPVLHRNLTPASLESAISRVKHRLCELKYLPTSDYKVDKVFDETTEAAVRQFQEENRLTIDGVVGPLTYACLYYPKLYRRMSDDSTEVKQAIGQLQEILRQEGLLEKEIGGRFGRATEKAVQKFQRQYGLKTDGIVGAVTWAMLLGMRQRAEAFPTALFFAPNYLPVFDQLLMVGFVVLGMHLSPLQVAQAPKFSTAIVTAYALAYVIPSLLEQLPLKLLSKSSFPLFRYSPYVFVGLFWEPLLGLLGNLMKSLVIR